MLSFSYASFLVEMCLCVCVCTAMIKCCRWVCEEFHRLQSAASHWQVNCCSFVTYWITCLAVIILKSLSSQY